MRLSAISLAVLLAAVPAAGATDPLNAAEKADQERDYLGAIKLAMGVARSAEETHERRYRAFRLVAGAYQQLDCPRLAVATYQQALVALGRYDPYAAEAWWRPAELHLNAERYSEACACIERALAEVDLAKLPWPHRFRLLRYRADCLARRGQLPEAVAINEALAAEAKQPEDLVAALGAAAPLHASLGEFGKAVEALTRLGAQVKSNALAYTAARPYQEVVGKLAAAGRRKEALALCGRAFATLGPHDASAAQQVLRSLVSMADEDETAVLDVAASLKGSAALAVASDAALEVLIPIASRAERADDLVRTCTHAMLARPMDEALAHTCLTAIVDLHTRQGRFGDALAAARAAYGVTGFAASSSTVSFTKAVGLVAHALRARDGHLVSGNCFRSYQTYGPAGPDRKPGTADDLANPIGELKLTPQPELDRLFDAALAAQPPTADGHRNRAWICLLWSRPEKALAAFKRAFATCSLEPAALSGAAQDVALGLKARDVTPVGMDAFALFQRYGPDGPDRRAGTADDLKDPLAGL